MFCGLCHSRNMAKQLTRTYINKYITQWLVCSVINNTKLGYACLTKNHHSLYNMLEHIEVENAVFVTMQSLHFYFC